MYLCHKRKISLAGKHTLEEHHHGSHHDANLRPQTNAPYKVSTFNTNSPDKILKLMVTMTRSKVNSRSQHNLAYLPPQPMSLPSIIFQFPRYSPAKILEVKLTTARLKVQSRSHCDVAHLHPLSMSL